MFGPQPERRADGRGVFFIFFARNPLKNPDSEKFMKTNESFFAFIDLHWLALACIGLHRFAEISR
jgi:hypothetical protein